MAIESRGTAEQEATHALAAVTRLLEHAAERARAQAQAEGPQSARHMLSWGTDLAACQAANLLPDDVDLEQAPSPVENDPLRLLHAAEELTRTVPIEAFPAGTSRLIVSICDLIREATP